ncbi:MAG: ABC transporter permease [Pseudomonadota bacterium]
MSDLHLALRLLAREWRAGELRLLLAVIALAVASLTAVAMFADRVRVSLGQEANVLLGADLVIAGDRPIDPALEPAAHAAGLATARTTTFLSMVRAGTRTSLAGIKGVGPGYPLRGQLRIADAPFAPDRPAPGIPAPGEAWVDPRLAGELGIGVGDPVNLGERSLRVAAILAHEGERGGNFLAMAPRLMLHETDLATSGLIQEGSRIAWRLLLAGPPEALAGFRKAHEAGLPRGQKFEAVRDARPELRNAVDRAERFLGLSALLSVALAAVAAHLLLRRYVARRHDQDALLRCFGATSRRLRRIYLIQFTGLGLVAGGLGSLLGLSAQGLIANLLGDTLRLTLAPPSWRPFALGLMAGLVLILAFSLPALRRLATVPALRVLRRDLGPPPAHSLLVQGLGLALIAGLALWFAGDLKLGLTALAGLAGAGLLSGLAARAALAPLGRLATRLPTAPRLGLLALHRRGWESTAQVVALSLGLLALLLLTLVRDDLLAAWKDSLPAEAPNRFLINIQTDQVTPLHDFLAARGVADVALYPMVRGRLVAIGERPVDPAAYQDDRARRLADREFNLSELADLPPDNHLRAGRWWRPGQTGGLSVEQGIAESLGIRLGDTLTYDIGGLPFTGTVTSLREVDWDSFRVNFFVVAQPGALAGLPASHITSFHLPPARGAVLSELVAQFPNVTVIDVDSVLNEMRAVMDRVSQAVQVFFLFTLAVGIGVLVAALYARRDERAREIGLWRTLGASRALARRALASEFAALGLLSGGLAAAAASAVAWLLAVQVFDLPHRPDPGLWLAGLGGGLALVLLVGLASTRGLVDAPPARALRASEA